MYYALKNHIKKHFYVIAKMSEKLLDFPDILVPYDLKLIPKTGLTAQSHHR